MRMNKGFKFFTISIFDGCSFKEFSTIVNQIEEAKISLHKIEVHALPPNDMEFFNPKSGGAHFPKFCIWESLNFPGKIMFISNYEDGLYTLCNKIHKQIKGNFIMCSLSNEQVTEYPFYSFHYSNSKFEERSILVYKENKWNFYETGIPLDIENTNYYKEKLIRKRLNNTIIEEYLSKLGIELWSIDSSIINCLTYIQNAW